MKTPGILFLLGIIFLDLCGLQGTTIIRNQRCSCISTTQRRIHQDSLKDLKKIVPSPACNKIEIIATMKNGDQACLNPKSADVKKLLKQWEKQNGQEKKQKKGKSDKKNKKVEKAKKPQRPRQKKTA